MLVNYDFYLTEEILFIESFLNFIHSNIVEINLPAVPKFEEKFTIVCRIKLALTWYPLMMKFPVVDSVMAQRSR